MSKLASDWKTGKTDGEKGLKEVLKKDPNKVSGTLPKFKGDLQKTLDKFESSHELIQKLQEKLEEEILKRTKLAEDCRKIISTYEDEISKLKVEGPQSRSKSVDKWTSALEGVTTSCSSVAGHHQLRINRS